MSQASTENQLLSPFYNCDNILVWMDVRDFSNPIRKLLRILDKGVTAVINNSFTFSNAGMMGYHRCNNIVVGRELV